MKLLALDSSAKSASCAVMTQEGQLLGESFSNNGYTHSKTLIPMVEQLLTILGLELKDIDCYAVCEGPGSFTGVRIGVAAAKGMAFAGEKPCIGISSLLGAAYNAEGFSGIICPVMDARREQVYNALFDNTHAKMERMCEDRVIAVEELGEALRGQEKPVLLVGDGAQLCYSVFCAMGVKASIIPMKDRLIRGSSVALAALAKLQQGEAVTGDALLPVYLRPSQAEREYEEKNK